MFLAVQYLLLMALMAAHAAPFKRGHPPRNDSEISRQSEPSQRRTPEFLLNIYYCINLHDDDTSRACLNFTGKNSEKIEDIIQANAVWGFVGLINDSRNGNDISFKIDHTSLSTDTKILSADLELFKRSLNKSEIEAISTEKCNISQDGIKLELILNDESIATINLTSLELQQDKWLDFPPLNKWYTKCLQNASKWSRTNESFVDLKLRLLSDCSSSLSLSDIGITTSAGYNPLLIIYANSPKDELADRLLHERLGDYVKRKRSVAASKAMFHPVNKTDPCHLITYAVPNKLIGSPLDGSFNLNFCGGLCLFPLSNSTVNHTMMQAYLYSTDHENVLKPLQPCCVPSAYQTLASFKRETSTTYVMVKYKQMTAIGCKCR